MVRIRLLKSNAGHEKHHSPPVWRFGLCQSRGKAESKGESADDLKVVTLLTDLQAH